MSNTDSTDDFYTYGGRDTYAPATNCRCMYHHGETPNPICYDREITASNHAVLASEARASVTIGARF